VHIIYSVRLLQYVSAFLYGDQHLVLQTYKKGKCFSGSGLLFTDNEYRISIICLLRVFQINDLIIILKYRLEIIKSACAAQIHFHACKCYLFFETPCVVDRGGPAFKCRCAVKIIYVTNIYEYITLCMLCVIVSYYESLLRVTLSPPCSIYQNILLINYHMLFWTPCIVNGRILNFFERVLFNWEPVFLTQYCVG